MLHYNHYLQLHIITHWSSSYLHVVRHEYLAQACLATAAAAFESKVLLEVALVAEEPLQVRQAVLVGDSRQQALLPFVAAVAVGRSRLLGRHKGFAPAVLPLAQVMVLARRHYIHLSSRRCIPLFPPVGGVSLQARLAICALELLRFQVSQCP